MARRRGDRVRSGNVWEAILILALISIPFTARWDLIGLGVVVSAPWALLLMVLAWI